MRGETEMAEEESGPKAKPKVGADTPKPDKKKTATKKRQFPKVPDNTECQNCGATLA